VFLEITNDFNFLLPIMLALAVSKAVADNMATPLFDMLIELKHIPFMEDEPTLTMQKIRCYHVMNRDVRALPVKTTVRDVLEVLNEDRHDHNGFPVVSDMEEFSLRGLILRAHLVAILTEKLFAGDAEDEHENAVKHSPTQWRMMCDLESLENVRAEEFTEEELDDDVNLQAFMSRAPFHTNDESPVSRAFDLFRKENLRHLPVVNDRGRVVGMITRSDLVDVQHHGNQYEHHGRLKRVNVDDLKKKANEADQLRQRTNLPGQRSQ
jgi:chloride channel 7